MKEITGKLVANGKKFAIVVARFNELITKNLLKGALESLHKYGAKDEAITVVWVPGSFEIPLVAKKLASTKKYHAVICLGALIRGDTPHFDYISQATALGIEQAARETGIPIIFGVLTTNTIEQALERSGPKHSNRGFDVANVAIEMANVIESL